MLFMVHLPTFPQVSLDSSRYNSVNEKSFYRPLRYVTFVRIGRKMFETDAYAFSDYASCYFD